MKRIDYLDGVRGVACLMVFLQHFMWIFYPASIEGLSSPIQGKFDLFIIRTPFNLYCNGNFAVTIFFVLSGFVLSYPFFKNVRIEFIIASMIKRIPRLFVPILASILFSVALLHAHCFYNIQAYAYTHSPWLMRASNIIPDWLAIFPIALHSLTVPQGDTVYNLVLWTMPIELYGSFLVFLLLLTFWAGWSRWIVYACLVALFWNSYLLMFLGGLILSDLKCNYPRALQIIFSKYTNIPYFTIIFIFGAYPFFVIPCSFYEHLQWGGLNYQNAHMLAAFLLLGIVIKSSVLQTFFTRRPVLFLGHISFSFYLIHNLIFFSFGSFIFIVLSGHVTYFLASLIACISTPMLALLLAFIMTQLVDRPSVKLSQKIYQGLKSLYNRASISHFSR